MATQGDPRRDLNPRPQTPSGQRNRAKWVPPKIVRHGSVRYLVRGITGFLTDTFGMPGMRKT